MKKRIWSILLTLCLAFTLLPTAALAEEPDGGSTVEMEAITSITAAGNGDGNWLNGANWDPDDASNHMKETSSGSGVYEITYTGVNKKDGGYQVIFAADGGWTNTWGVNDGTTALSGDAIHNGYAITFSVAQDNSTVKLVLDLSGLDRATGDGAKYTIEVTPPDAAEMSSAEVSTQEELNAALSNASVTEIHIIADMTYNDPLNAIKPVQVNKGVTLTISGSNTTVSGTIVNNGTVKVTSNWVCLWKAQTAGTGKLIGGKDRWGDPSTYVDYGCVPEAMLDGCRINIVKDISQAVTATLPENMQTGDTINVTFDNLIEGVNPADVFKFTWKDGSSFPIYDNAATPTLTKPGELKLSLTPNKPYVMRTSNGTMGSLDAQGTVTQKLLDTVYVDQSNGNDSNLGDTAAQPVKRIDKALDKITDDGQIVLLSNYRGRIVFNKSVTVKCEDENAFTLTSSSPNYVSDGVTVTLKNLIFSDSTFCRDTQGTGSLIFTNCTGSLSIGSGDISNITMENSQLSGNISASESLSMKSSTFSGQFNTKNFAAEGDCTISCKENAPSFISGTVTAGTPVKLVPFENAKAGDKLLEVPNSIAATSFALSDTSGVYGVVFSAQYNGNYLCLAQRITSENGKIAVGNEPQINHVPTTPARVRLSGFGSEISTFDAAWSGNVGTSWSTDEIPKLIVTLKANDGYFFDDSFDVNKLQVYSWTDMTTSPAFDNEAKNDKVTCKVEDGQGVSSDGKTFTFTIQYPKIERLEQKLTMDTTDRTASCKEVLQPRHVGNAQGTLSYESSNPQIASVDSATGVITVNKPGTVTITIHAAQTDVYAAAETSYNLVVSHKYSDTFKTDGKTHWKECACGERTEMGNHSGGTATCTEKATCEICGEKYGDLKPHSYSTEWSTDETKHWHKCTECGAKKDEAEHTDADKDHKCDVCEKVLSECADNDKDHKCDLCGKTLSEHTGGTATCTEQATCEICGEKYGDLKPHSYSTEWSTDETKHWHKCTECGAKKDEAEHTDADKDHKCDVCEKVLSECADNDKDHKCDLCGKTLSEHTGGTATCKDKAKCEICGESYGELDSNNHVHLKRFPATAATKTSEGNIEYWYCEGCGKYYKDAAATQEITKEQTVTTKLPSDNNTSAGGSTGNNNKPSSNATTLPQTGDNFNIELWVSLLLVSGVGVTATTVYGRKKKRSGK